MEIFSNFLSVVSVLLDYFLSHYFLLISLFFLQLDTIRAVLKKELEIPLVEISDKNARLDGGDVLFTGNFCVKYVSKFIFLKRQPEIQVQVDWKCSRNIGTKVAAKVTIQKPGI